MLHTVSNTAVVHNTGVLFQEIPLLTHSLNIHCFCVIRYDEEQAQSENAERDLRSRSGQSLGSKGTKGSAGVRPTAATWKWSDNFSLKFTSCTTLQGPSVVNHLDFFFFKHIGQMLPPSRFHWLWHREQWHCCSVEKNQLCAHIEKVEKLVFVTVYMNVKQNKWNWQCSDRFKVKSSRSNITYSSGFHN